MKVTYNWLKDFVEIKISPQALAERLTMAGLEVTSLEGCKGDFVFEIEVTANRSDCLSVIGIAREVAAITGKKLAGEPVSQLASLNRQTGKPADRLTINIENKKDCPLYTAKIIKDVKVGPSPDWLKRRLELVGCRTVNNIVDITNYILFTCGQPLHAFDLNKIVSQLASEPVGQLEIKIRRAIKGEEIVTIDGIKRRLDENILLVACGVNRQTDRPIDRQTDRPIAIAGIMGGRDTEVTEDTKDILLESAIFDPIIVRRGRQRLGLESESAYRFERGIDVKMVSGASAWTVALIQKFAGGRLVLAKKTAGFKKKNIAVNFDLACVSKILGVNINSQKIKTILANLGFRVHPLRSKAPRATAASLVRTFLRVQIPSHRLDVRSEIDLVEEIARIYGYARIPKTIPLISPPTDAPNQNHISILKSILVALGLNEVITYSLINKEELKYLRCAEDVVEILNPLSKGQQCLRPTLIPSLCRRILYNLNQRQEYVPIFEIAKVFRQTNALPEEEWVLGIALSGVRSWWLSQGRVKEEVGLLHLKGIVEELLQRLGIKEYGFNLLEESPEKAELCVRKERLGTIEKLPRNFLENLGIKDKDVFAGEISLERLLTYTDLKKKFVPLAVYPGISRDISLIVKEEVGVEKLLASIRQSAGALLEEVKIIDYYRGRQIPPAFKGLTLSCCYRSSERTLTEAEINPLHALVIQTLTEKFAAQLR